MIQVIVSNARYPEYAQARVLFLTCLRGEVSQYGRDIPCRQQN